MTKIVNTLQESIAANLQWVVTDDEAFYCFSSYNEARECYERMLFNTAPRIIELNDLKPTQKFKVFKVGRKSGRRSIICRNLTENEAQKLVKSFPNSNRSMICYTVQ